MGFKPNAMLAAHDPVQTVMSLNSVALEKINQRNADRLLKLDNDDDLNNSAFFDQISLASAKKPIPDIKHSRAGWEKQPSGVQNKGLPPRP